MYDDNNFKKNAAVCPICETSISGSKWACTVNEGPIFGLYEFSATGAWRSNWEHLCYLARTELNKICCLKNILRCLQWICMILWQKLTWTSKFRPIILRYFDPRTPTSSPTRSSLRFDANDNTRSLVWERRWNTTSYRKQ